SANRGPRDGRRALDPGRRRCCRNGATRTRSRTLAAILGVPVRRGLRPTPFVRRWRYRPGGGDRQVSIVERVREIVEPLLARHSLEVYDVELNGSQLRVTVDRLAGAAEGLDLDTIAQATRLVSLALDEHDPIDARYTLEV